MEKNKEPFLHVTRRGDISKPKAIKIRITAILLGFLLGYLLLLFTAGADPFTFIGTMFNGAFGTPKRIWNLLREISLLLLVGLALLPAFKMKFWNLGGNGQILMGSLATIICMIYLGKANWSNGLILLVSIPCSVLAGVIYAIIPAIFKALFNTNESLFTLMLNYIAVGIVALFIKIAVPNGSGALGIVSTGWLPQIGGVSFAGRDHVLTIIIAVIVLLVMFSYLKYSKHGYELEVVGESLNTARYIGINVKKVIIRTMAFSGAICGLVGLLLAGAINHSISEASHNNMGFTAIMVSWLAHLNPFTMVGTSFLVGFLNSGMSQVRIQFGITNDSISSIIVGIIYFFIIGSEFFINYRLHFKDCELVRTFRKVSSPIKKFFDKVNKKTYELFIKIKSKLSKKEAK